MMDKERARQVLRCCKENTPGNDAEIAAALEFARTDPELAAWFEEGQQLDRALQAKLREAAIPPPGLKEEIVHRFRNQPSQTGRILLFRRAFAIAASIAILLAVALLSMNRQVREQPDELTAFRIEMASFLNQFPKLDFYAEKQEEIRKWFAARDRLATFSIPPELAKFPTIGCREIVWRNKRAALICLVVDGEVIHLFALPAEEWTGAAPPSPHFIKDRARNSAIWKQSNVIHVAITSGSQQFLRKTLSIPAG